MTAPFARSGDVHIVAYDPARAEHRDAFRELNLAWIEAHFVVEARVLVPAVTLYHALGFVEVPLPATDYSRANLKMVLELR